MFFTSVDLIGMVLNVFHEERCDLCWKNKDQEEGRRRTIPVNLETFCRVLPLFVETCGRLLSPFEKPYGSSKEPLEMPKALSGCCKLSHLGWLACSQ